MKKLVFSSLSLLAFAAVLAFTPVQNWKIKDTYSIQFSSNDASGIFKTFSGTIVFDPADLAKAKFDLTVAVESISTGNGMMNKHAKGDEWFNADKYPSIKFTATKFEKAGTDFKATGTLEIRGIKKEVTVPFSFKKNLFKANFSVNRNDFKVGKADAGVANTIKIEATVPVSKK
jgi:polyisoprenoid-binding protein YceI